MRKYKNIYEEVNRMKSLFSDDRLYGNLINEYVNHEKPLLLEQPGGIIGKWIDDIWGAVASTGVLKKISIIDNAVYTFDNLGNILKNGKIIDKTNLSNFITKDLFDKLTFQLNTISQDKTNFIKYLNGSGGDVTLKKQFYEIIDSLEKQDLIRSKTIQTLKSSIDQTGIWGSINEIFKHENSIKDFYKSINSDLEFKNKYPEIYNIFNSVPSLKNQFYSRFKPEGHEIFSNDFDAFLEFYNILKTTEIKELDDAGNVIGSRMAIEDYDIEYNQSTKEITFVNYYGGKPPSNVEKKLREYGEKYKSVKPDVVGANDKIVSPFTISNNGNIKLNNVVLKADEKAKIYALLNQGTPLPVKPSVTTKNVILNDVDFEKGDLFLSKSEAFRRYANPFNIYERYVADEFRNFVKEIISRGLKFSDFPIMQRGLDVFSFRMSQLLNPEYLIKNGYKYTGQSGTKQIDDNWRQILEQLWKAEEGKASIFIKTEEESLKYGKGIGEFKPMNVIERVPNQKQVLKSEFHKQWLKHVTGGITGGYEKVDVIKAWRNRILKGTTYTLLGTMFTDLILFIFGQEIFFYEYFLKLKLEAIKEYIRGKDPDPNIIYPGVAIQYSKKCQKAVEDQVLSVFGESGKKVNDTLFGADISTNDGNVEVRGGLLSGMFTVSQKDPQKWNTDTDGDPIIYNDSDKLPLIETYKTKADLRSIVSLTDGNKIEGIGVIRKGEKVDGRDTWYIETEKVIDGKYRTISLGCSDFKEFWIDSWKEFYKLVKDDSEFEKKIQELLENLPDSSKPRDVINKALETITIDALVEKVEGGFEKVKEGGEEAEEWIQQNVPGGTSGNSGGIGTVGEY